MRNLRQSTLACIAGTSLLFVSAATGNAQAPLRLAVKQNTQAQLSPATLQMLRSVAAKEFTNRKAQKAITGGEKTTATGKKNQVSDRVLAGNLPGTQISSTHYDFQSNASMPERVAITKIGSETFVNTIWMSADEEDWTDRGTDLVVMQATSPGQLELISAVKDGGRIEQNRAGFPAIVSYPDGNVGFPSHTNYSADLTSVIYTKNDELAGETFVSTDVKPATSLDDNTLWPRAARDESNTIHVIYTYNAGDKNGQLGYSRSTDGGTTWSPEVLFTGPNALPGQNVTTVDGSGADTYAITAKGNTVVVVYSDADLGLHMRKSTDNGVTWSHSLVYAPEHQNVYTEPANPSEGDEVYFVTDSVRSPGTHMDVIIDNEGLANIVFTSIPSTLHGYGTITNGQVQRTGNDTVSSYAVYLSLGMWYYKEGTTALIDMAPPAGGTWDQGGTMISRRFGSGFSRLPQLGIDNNNNIYCVYTSIKNGDTSTTQGFTDSEGTFYGGLYGHIYATHKPAGGDAWSTPLDLTPEGMDCLYGTLANDVVDGYMYYAYSANDVPGDRVTETGEPSPDLTYPVVKDNVYLAALDIAQLNFVGVNDVADANLSLGAVAPNPASGMARLSYSLKTDGNASIEITNVMGQKVLAINEGFKTVGEYNVSFNASELPVGTYYYTLKHNGNSITRMMSVVR